MSTTEAAGNGSFDLLFRKSPTAVLAARLRDGCIAYVNEAFLSVYGYRREEVIGRRERELKLGRSEQERAELNARFARRGCINDFVYEYRHKSGRTGCGVVSAISASVDGEDGVLAFMFAGENLEETQRNLIEAERSYRRIFDTMSASCFLARVIYQDGKPVDLVYLRVNKTFERMTGMAGVAGKRRSDVFPGWLTPGNDPLLDIYGRVAAGGRAERVEHCFGDAGRWFELTAYSPQPEEIVVIVDEVTERKRIEAELHGITSRLEAALAGMEEAVFMVAADGRVTDFNDAFVSFGRFRDRVECRRHLDEYPDLFEMTVSDGVVLPLAEWPISRALRGEHGRDAEFLLKRRDTGESWITRFNFAPMRDPAGAILGAVVTARDITESRRRDEELKAHREHLEDLVRERTAELADARMAAEAASRAKTTFLGNMSHELRTPLNGIIGMTELALMYASDEKQMRFLNAALQSSRNLQDIITDILDATRIELNEIKLVGEEFILGDILPKLRSRLEERAAEKGLGLVTDMPDELGRQLVAGDWRRLLEVLVALVRNAIKFTDHGLVQVVASLGRSDQREIVVRFEVRDTGIGLDSGIQQRLFDLFAQGDDSMTRKHGGLGLGLFIASRLIALMKGRIGFESEPKRGSVFWFEVPLSRISA